MDELLFGDIHELCELVRQLFRIVDFLFDDFHDLCEFVRWLFVMIAQVNQNGVRYGAVYCSIG